jgi:hypothetical protein
LVQIEERNELPGAGGRKKRTALSAAAPMSGCVVLPAELNRGVAFSWRA